MDEVISDTKIVVPDGKLEASGDFAIQQVQLELNGRNQTVDLIKQRFSGNCAEYTALNTAILLLKVGVVTNQRVEKYLQSHRSLDMSTVEKDLVIPLLLDAQENYQGIRSSEADVDNLSIKADNPYAPLSTTNSALLFRSTLNISPEDFQSQDVAQSYTPEIDNRISGTEILALFIGSGDHATSYIKLGKDFYYIDPLSTDLVEKRNVAQARNHLRQILERQNSFITLNELRTR